MGSISTLTPEEQELIRKIWRTYKKAWRKQNPEKEAEYQRRYWKKKVDALKQENKEGRK